VFSFGDFCLLLIFSVKQIMKTFQFKIELVHTENPVVWRRLLVPEDIDFDDFHLAIQAVFGWDFSHLYQFSAKGWGSKPYYQPLGEWAEDDGDMRDSEDYLISEVFKRAGQKYTYIYDFGDDWRTGITFAQHAATYYSLFTHLFADHG
jgi:hypothetical protein